MASRRMVAVRNALPGMLEARGAQARGIRTSPQALLDAVDWMLALVLALLSLPLVGAACLWILAVDFGSPFFVQERIGRGGRPFRMFKLRTMWRRCQSREARFCGRNDPRILPGGCMLRRLRIDEIPQFLNVLKGDMALVGPRPEQPAFVKEFQRTLPGYMRRHDVKPGITGLAQVRMGYVDDANGTRRKLRYDLLFVKRRSLRVWLYIVARTVGVITRLMGR